MISHRWNLLVVGLVCLLGFGGHARAQIINLQFKENWAPTQSGGAVIGSAGDFWNTSGFNATNLSLADQNNIATSVMFSNSGNGGEYSTGPSGTGFKDTPYENLMGGYLVTTDIYEMASIFSFSGLNSTSKYNLYIYTQGDKDGSNGRQLGVEIGANQQISNPTDKTASTFILNQNYLLFSNISPDGTGTISAKWWNAWAGINGEANINGIQLVQAVPEPGSMILTGLALVSMGGAAYRRRKGKVSENNEATA